jgi:hypothetical protein
MMVLKAEERLGALGEGEETVFVGNLSHLDDFGCI